MADEQINDGGTAVVSDPTAFRPMATTASADLPIGHVVEPIVKRLTLDKSRIYQGWPEVRNRHTDYAAAQATGLAEPNINGGQTAESVGELFIKFFGRGIFGGSLELKFVGSVALDTVVTARGIVTDKVMENGRAKLVLDVWAEDETGRKVIVGSAAGFAD